MVNTFSGKINRYRIYLGEDFVQRVVDIFRIADDVGDSVATVQEEASAQKGVCEE